MDKRVTRSVSCSTELDVDQGHGVSDNQCGNQASNHKQNTKHQNSDAMMEPSSVNPKSNQNRKQRKKC